MATGTELVAELPSTAQIEGFKAQVRAERTDPALVAAHRRWEVKEATFGREATAIIVERARVEPGMTVLDLASGSGETAHVLAGAVGQRGHVTATDPRPDLLALAEERARRRGLASLTFRVADVQHLPFPDGAFDRVTCGSGLSLFGNPAQALRESLRVLKPGGRAVFLEWGAPSGVLAAEMDKAGFAGVEEERAPLVTDAPCARARLAIAFAIAAGTRPRRSISRPPAR